MLNWDGKTLSGWSNEIDGSDIVINLAGRSVNCRYNQHNRKVITESRVNSTRAVGEAIKTAKTPPSLWLQMSTATAYAHRFDAANDEIDGILGGNEPDLPETWNFSIDVVKAWEKAVEEAEISEDTRKVILRLSIVMAPEEGGVFEALMRLTKMGLGGQQGDGKQYVSWITDIDLVRAIDFIIENKELSGPVNLASPNPLPNAEFMSNLRKAANIPFGLPAYEWMLEIGAVILQTETELILKSRRVVPRKLLEKGFTYEQPEWSEAVRDLCKRYKQDV